MLKTTLLASLSALAALLAVPSASLAQSEGARLEAKFRAADKDNDGTLDRMEAKAMPRVAKRFDAIDTDNDGTVSLAEVQAFMAQTRKKLQERTEAAFKKADKDNDGTLDKEEAKAMPPVADFFEVIDVDKDGTVSMEEIDNFMKARRKHGNN